MSYDIYLRNSPCPTCGRPGLEPDISWGPTYNLTPIFDLALTGEPLPNPDVPEGSVVLFRKETDRPRGLRVLSGRLAGETIADLTRAIERLTDPDLQERFTALEPDNKWGTLPVAVEVCVGLRKLAIAHPQMTWEIY